MVSIDEGLSPFDLTTAASPVEVAAVVAEHGLAVIPGYLDTGTADRLAAESTALLADDAPWLIPEDYSLGSSTRMWRRDIDVSRYPLLDSVFGHEFLEAVTAAHFGEDYIFSRTVYVILDVVGTSTHVQELHYDKMRHLKAFIYLSDVGQGEGPFWCVPGSHRTCQALQAGNRERRVLPTDADVRVLPSELESSAIPVLGDRGTLIVFDSDIAHRAGVPTSGPRLAARSLSFGAYRHDDWYWPDGTLSEVRA
jgi:hypothetical protein